MGSATSGTIGLKIKDWAIYPDELLSGISIAVGALAYSPVGYSLSDSAFSDSSGSVAATSGALRAATVRADLCASRTAAFGRPWVGIPLASGGTASIALPGSTPTCTTSGSVIFDGTRCTIDGNTANVNWANLFPSPYSTLAKGSFRIKYTKHTGGMAAGSYYVLLLGANACLQLDIATNYFQYRIVDVTAGTVSANGALVTTNDVEYEVLLTFDCAAGILRGFVNGALDAYATFASGSHVVTGSNVTSEFLGSGTAYYMIRDLAVYPDALFPNVGTVVGGAGTGYSPGYALADALAVDSGGDLSTNSLIHAGALTVAGNAAVAGNLFISTPAFNLYQTTSANYTLTGPDTVAVTVNFVKIGHLVIAHSPEYTGTSNSSTYFTWDAGFPSGYYNSTDDTLLPTTVGYSVAGVPRILAVWLYIPHLTGIPKIWNNTLADWIFTAAQPYMIQINHTYYV